LAVKVLDVQTAPVGEVITEPVPVPYPTATNSPRDWLQQTDLKLETPVTVVQSDPFVEYATELLVPTVTNLSPPQHTLWYPPPVDALAVHTTPSGDVRIKVPYETVQNSPRVGLHETDVHWSTSEDMIS
jgi:hypothetical protein